MLRIRLDDDFYLKEATVYGIVSELPDYRLCFFLNNDLSLKLTRNTADRKLHYKGLDYTYSEFSFEHPVHEIVWTLTANKSYGPTTGGETLAFEVGTELPLVSDLKSFDFFLWYDGEPNAETNRFLNHRLKELSYVRAFREIDHSQSKNINNLLLEY